MMTSNLNVIIHKEIDLIQSCINRMANNSFFVKGGMITLLSALVILLTYNIEVQIIAGLTSVVVFCCWYLDGFFLKTEKLYRLKYEWVIVERPKGNFENLYDLNPYNKAMWKNSKNTESIVRVMFTKTLIPFYALPLAIAVASIIWAYVPLI